MDKALPGDTPIIRTTIPQPGPMAEPVPVPLNSVICGHVLEVLRSFPDESVHCVVTSPPYWGLRDYGVEHQVWGGDPRCDHVFTETPEPNGNGTGSSFRRDREGWMKRGGHQPGFCVKCGAWLGSYGLEPTPELYVQHTVAIFREVRRVLRADGTLWLNIGDTYSQDTKWGGRSGNKNYTSLAGGYGTCRNLRTESGVKAKNLCMMPARVALALQADGWYLRSQIPWLKRTAMPESCKDRPTSAVEYVFMLSKSRRYYYNWKAITLAASLDSHARYGRARSDQQRQKPVSGWDTGPGNHCAMVGRYKQNESFSGSIKDVVEIRARRNSDWFFESWQGLLVDEGGEPLAFVVNPKGFQGAHFATFPAKLVEPMIQAGCPEGGVVLDCFGGSGTVGVGAKKLQRHYVLIDLKPEYCAMGEKRIERECGGLL